MTSSSLLTVAGFERLFRFHPVPPGWAAHCHEVLLRAYDEPHRTYHTHTHLQGLLASFQQVYGMLQQPEAVFTAAWYHDVIYKPQRTDNEEASAELARRHLLEGGCQKSS